MRGLSVRRIAICEGRPERHTNLISLFADSFALASVRQMAALIATAMPALKIGAGVAKGVTRPHAAGYRLKRTARRTGHDRRC